MEKKENRIIDTWLRKHHLIYAAATRHPFILTIRDGTIDLSAFKTWLAQDYLFVRESIPFVATVLAKAWKQSDDNHTDTEVILGGMASLNDEVAWFKNEASKWGIQLTDVVPQKPNKSYCTFLESLMAPEIEYAMLITAFWAIEAVYQESFAHCLEDEAKIPDVLQGTCQRWGNDGFGQYCESLKRIANRHLELISDNLLPKAHEDLLAKAETVFLRVLEHEVEFWNMSLGEANSTST
ncbi:hypothetical protein ACFE04_007972 [Oxalis oulophora]